MKALYTRKIIYTGASKINKISTDLTSTYVIESPSESDYVWSDRKLILLIPSATGEFIRLYRHEDRQIEQRQLVGEFVRGHVQSIEDDAAIVAGATARRVIRQALSLDVRRHRGERARRKTVGNKRTYDGKLWETGELPVIVVGERGRSRTAGNAVRGSFSKRFGLGPGVAFPVDLEWVWFAAVAVWGFVVVRFMIL